MDHTPAYLPQEPNRFIGRKHELAELSISPTTAARHVANILAKLGFRSRTQIAAWVADRPSRADGPT